MFLVPVQLQQQVGNDRVSVLDGPRMGGAFGYQGGVGLSLEALLRGGIAERESQKLLTQPFARQIMPAHQAENRPDLEGSCSYRSLPKSGLNGNPKTTGKSIKHDPNRPSWATMSSVAFASLCLPSASQAARGSG